MVGSPHRQFRARDFNVGDLEIVAHEDVVDAGDRTTAGPRPPGAVVAAAQVVVGAALGSRFRGLTLARAGHAAALALGLTVLMLGMTVGAAWLLGRLTGIGIAGLILAYAPGGLAEMSLIALALGTDVAFVSTHHIVRIVIIVTLAPTVFLLWRRWSGRPAAPPPAPHGGG